MPGTDNPRVLEASILLARGGEARGTGDIKEAMANYEPALKLAPRNGLLAYVQALSLMDLKRYDEAFLMWARVARFGKGKRAAEAKYQLSLRPAEREAAIREAAKIP